ncbi:MAG: ATP-binding protein [Deltaproteobacteria bacterium]|nr:ATP-binding protein [Deltaproteobacteria bacterium]
MFQPKQFRSQVLADKFYPPRVDTSPFLFRQRVVDQLLLQGGTRAPAIIIEAQAGQGKTTIIKQFLDRTEAAVVWYQVGAEDADPAFFLQAIQACINTRLPDFPSAATAQVMEESDFVLFGLQKRIKLLLRDLDSFLEDDLYFVFDDLHYLVPHQASLLAVNALLEAAPSRLHFILSSRESLPLPNRRLITRGRNLLRLGNRDLAMNEGEVTDFFQQVFNLDVSRDIIKTVTRTTDGWVMGVLLLGLQMERQDGKNPHPSLERAAGVNQQGIHQFFRDEILSTLEPRLHRPLLLLSLLEVIPVDLAVEITGVENIGVDLCELVRCNIFFRHLDPDNTLFGLHHLFRQFLREKAAAELSPETIRQIYRQAGRFCLRRERPARALRYLLRAGDYDAVEAVLKDHGMSFLVSNRTATLAAILERIPAPLLHQYGWATFYSALAYIDSAPGRVLPLLDQALAVFAARQDRLGELLTLSHIISIHITTTGHYLEGKGLLQRAEQLFYQISTLDVFQTILVVRNLAMGHCILLADFDRATKFASLGLNLARKENLVNFEAALLVVIGYIQIFAGRTSLARVYLEQAAPYVHRPEIGLFNKLSIRMLQFSFLFHDGDFANYFDQKNQFIAAIGNTLVSQSIAGPFCTIWEMDIAINQGRFGEAQGLAERALVLIPPLSPHLRSLILQFKALIMALRRQCGPAMPVAAESRRLRGLSGGPYFVALNKIMGGLTCFHCGRHDQAVQLLSAGIEGARRMSTESLEACGLLHRASVYLRAGARQQAGRDIEAGLRLMRRNSYRHFWTWTPAAMREVLTFAVAQRLEPEYARTLAAGRLGLALLDDGAAIPLLDIRTLGGFKILYRGTTLLHAEELTPSQRELLCLLLSAPEFKLPQETIQLHFWPDSPPDTARIKFDTLLSRLRKTLARVLPANTVHFYLKREKGMLWLAHCRVDALEFLAAVDRGIRHLRLQECWQAGNAFAAAESLWQGEFAPGVTGEDRIRACREKLSRALADLAFAWCDLLVDSDRLPKAVQVAEKALRDDPLNDRLCGLLYRLQGRSSAVLARQVLKRFAAALQAEDYQDDEIAELVAGITADQPHEDEDPA